MPRDYTDILYETKDHVARITINRPRQYNAFTGDTLKELSGTRCTSPCRAAREAEA